jgi:hypothetical protein
MMKITIKGAKMIKRVFRKSTLICGLYLISLVMPVLFTPVQAAIIDFDRYYPSYTDLVDFLDDLDASPIVSTRTIGLSNDGREIVAIRISDNPDVDEDEPAFLFVGVIHGNEPLGIRVVLDLIETLTESYGSDTDITNWVNAYEIWIVPVLNPYGYDNSWRKNGPNISGNLNDSGVDLNRNFDFRWNYATLELSNPETYIHYRGPSAASEPEIQAISNLVVAQRPIFGITFHSGSGGNDGKIMYPWTPNNWGLVNQDPPDKDRIKAIADVIADAVNAYRGGANRPDDGTAGAIGQSNVYNYAVTGMFDYMLETSDTKWSREDEDNDGNEDYPFFYDVDLDDSSTTPGMQNALIDAQELVDAYHDGITGLMRYFLFDDAGGFSFRGPGVTGIVTDCLTGAPLSATVKVIEIDDTDGDGDVDDTDRDIDADGDFDTEFRIAEPIFGRYVRFLEPGTWTLDFSLPGYDQVTTSVSVVDNASGVELIELDVALDPGIDTDGDGLRDCEEIQVHLTDPEDSDTDDDGYSDSEEIDAGSDPTDPNSFPNEPPVCDANGPYVAECSGAITSIELDGTGSSDPNPGDILSYSWGSSCSGSSFDDATSATPMLSVDSISGSTIVCNASLTVTDSYGASDSCLSTITVEDTLPPSITCPSSTAIECDQSPDPAITGTALVTDVCDPGPSVTFSDSVRPGACSEESTIARTWTTTDASGNSSSCMQIIEVVDTTPPVIESLSVSPDVLWPPNHKLIPVITSVDVSDNCDSSPTVALVSITMNESDETMTFDPAYDSTIGDGNTIDDIHVDANGNISLRAERSGTGNGRIYTITYAATDCSGNSSTADVIVTVPHNQ